MLSHMSNQPLNQVLGNVHSLFAATPLIHLPATRIGCLPARRIRRPCRLRRLQRHHSAADRRPSGLMNAPNDPTFTGGIGGQVGGLGLLPACRKRGRCGANANQVVSGSFTPAALLARHSPGAPTCPLAVSLNTFPRDAQDSVLLPVQSRHRAADRRARRLRADYVGTRGLHEPYQVQLNGYQTFARMLCAIPLSAAARSALRQPSPSSAPMPTASTTDCRPSTRSNGAA
jgi:hypothetical protein